MSNGKRLVRWVWSVILYCGILVAALPGTTNAQTVLWKKCSGCGRIVAINSQAGQTCPHCGIYWAAEQTNYVPGGSDGGYSPGGPAFIPTPRNSYERMALYQAMVQQQLIQRQMALDQIAAQKWQAEHQMQVERCEKLRERESSKREDIYRRVAERCEAYRQNDNPVQRAERHLAAGLRSEQEQDPRAAIAYYRLAERTAPNSTAGIRAAEALARLDAP